MVKAMDSNFDLEEAIISINENKQVTENIGRNIVLDLSKEEFEYKNLMYPICMVDEYSLWRREFNKYWKHDSVKSEFWDDFEDKIINSFNKYMLPVIIMKKENKKEAVCQVFEKVNTGGVSLTVFELLTATFASDDFDLKQDWLEIKEGFQKMKLLSNVGNTELIQAITLLSTYSEKMIKVKSNAPGEELPAVSCKRKDMLNLSLLNYKTYKDSIVQGYFRASKILLENHIFNARDLPYNSMFKFFLAELWQVASNGTPQDLWVGHREGM